MTLGRLWKRIPGGLYKKAFDNSKAYHGTLMVVFVSPAFARMVGFTASRKVGGSVERNHARRLMKEAFRAISDNLVPDVSYILVARRAIMSASVQDVQRELDRLTSAYRHP